MHPATCLTEAWTKDPVPGLSGALTMKQPLSVMRINFTAVAILYPLPVSNCRIWIQWVFISSGFLFNCQSVIQVQLFTCIQFYMPNGLPYLQHGPPRAIHLYSEHLVQHTECRVFCAPPTRNFKRLVLPLRFGVLWVDSLTGHHPSSPANFKNLVLTWISNTLLSTQHGGQEVKRLGLCGVGMSFIQDWNHQELWQGFCERSDRDASTEIFKEWEGGTEGSVVTAASRSDDMRVKVGDSGERGREQSFRQQGEHHLRAQGKEGMWVQEAWFSKGKPGCCGGRTTEWLLGGWEPKWSLTGIWPMR